MKTNKLNRWLLLFAALPLICMTGCDKENIGGEEPGGKTGTSEIKFEFGIATEAQPKQAWAGNMNTPQPLAATAPDFTATWEDGDQIGLFAVRHTSGGTGTLAASGNYIHNVKLSYDGSTWTPETDLYFPSGTDQLDFYAYYPYNAAATNPLNIAFNVSTNQSALTAGKPNYNASDLLVGTPTKNVARSTSPVALTFRHALALVEVTFKKDYANNAGPEGNLQVSIRNMKTGVTLNLGAGTNGSVSTTGNAQSVKMVQVAGTQTYRALVPAQDVAATTPLFFFEQFNELYSYTAAVATLAQGTAKRYEIEAVPFLPAVKIKAGTFQMGQTGVAEPVHTVTLSGDFHMSKYQITNAQYAAFLNAASVGENRTATVTGFGPQVLFTLNVYWNVAWNTTDSKWEAVSGKENHPMMQVTWYGAKAFADWVGGALPTEAQWEYACRAGTTTAYSFGDAEVDLANYGWYSANSGGAPNIVGTKLPNPWGLYDMHGNMYEWCSDWYANNYYSNPSAGTDPTGPAAGDGRVLRGGSWNNDAQGCRSASRHLSNPVNAPYYFGFRVVFPL